MRLPSIPLHAIALLLGAPEVLRAMPALAFRVQPSVARVPAQYPDVTVEEAGAILTRIRSVAANTSNLGWLETVRGLDVENPRHRDLLAPVKAAGAVAHWEGIERPVEILEWVPVLLEDRMEYWQRRVLAPVASEAELETSVATLQTYSDLVALYAPGQLAGLQAALKAGRSRLADMRFSGVDGAITRASLSARLLGRETAELPPGVVDGAPPVRLDPEQDVLTTVERYFRQLRAATGLSLRRMIILRLEDLPRPSESVQRIILQGLIKDLERRREEPFLVSAAIQSIATSSRFDNVREIALRGLMKAAGGRPSGNAQDELLEASADIAVQARAPRVKRLAVELLGKLPAPSESVDAMRIKHLIARVAGSIREGAEDVSLISLREEPSVAARALEAGDRARADDRGDTFLQRIGVLLLMLLAFFGVGGLVYMAFCLLVDAFVWRSR